MSQTQKRYQRFSIWERVEHLVLIISFTTLGLTGLPQKYALSPISQFFINILGGIESIRVIHRIAATIFLLEAVYHIVVVGYKLFIQRKEASMLPGIKDAQDAAQSFGYNVGIVKEAPKMPRYNFTEKAEYWAMLWGLFVMAVTGFMLWNPIATTNIMPGEFIPAAKVAHGGEAVLAVLAIVLWHFYNVHLKHMNWSMFRGTMSRHEMEEEHGAELEQIESGRLPRPPAPAEARRRLAIFVPVAAVFSLALAGLVYYFVTFETSSVTTLPPAERVSAFAPQTPTPAPTAEPPAAGGPEGIAVDWDGAVGPMFQESCASCHGSIGGFNAESYEEVMKAVTPGDPEASSVVEVQREGGHPGQLTEDQINTLVAWIQSGAPQSAGTGGLSQEGSASEESGGGEAAAATTWAGGIETLFADRCGACHGSMGGFNAESYEEVMKAVTPGDPDASQVVEGQRAGDHPGTFEADELEQVIQWIQSGAPQE